MVAEVRPLALDEGLATAAATFVVFEGVGIVAGEKGYIGPLGFECDIVAATMLGSSVGDAELDILKTTFDDYPANAASITGGNTLQFSGATKVQDEILAGWDVSLGPDDVLIFEIVDPTDIDRLTITLELRKT